MRSYLLKHPLSGQILNCDGRWQLIYGFFAKNVFQLNEELKKFNTLFGDYIKENEKIIHLGSHHYFRGYLINKELIRTEEPFLGGHEEEIIKLDKTNLELLNLLRFNARINLIELTKKLKISLDQLRYKLKKLSKEQIIIGYWLNLNPEKINLHFYRILLKLKNFDNQTEKRFLYFLNEHKNIIRANNIFGSWDFIIDLEINAKDFRNFIYLLTNTFSDQIQEYETLMIYDELQFTFSPQF